MRCRPNDAPDALGDLPCQLPSARTDDHTVEPSASWGLRSVHKSLRAGVRPTNARRRVGQVRHFARLLPYIGRATGKNAPRSWSYARISVGSVASRVCIRYIGASEATNGEWHHSRVETLTPDESLDGCEFSR